MYLEHSKTPAASGMLASFRSLVIVIAASAALFSNVSASESGAPLEPKHVEWPFEGMTGHLDKQAAQRGFQVYKQVCSACHSMNLVAYRSLSKLGFEEAEIKAIAAEKQIEDFDEKGTGERVQRPAKPFDHFVAPFANEDASRTANGGAYPPDLSLIIKAREHGPNYIYSLLTGFAAAPAGVDVVAGKNYNPYFPGHWLSMRAPLNEGALEYQDGTKATIDQMARDVVVFLQWAAEPETAERHEMGLKVLVFLGFMSVFFLIAKRRVWKNLKH